MADFELVCADASALINMIGSGVPEEVLLALEAKTVVTKQVLKEVRRCPFESKHAEGPLVPLREGGFLEVVELDDETIEVFLSLVGAKPPDDLDDGEASTIAYGVTHGAVVVIDERKGRRICRERFPALRTLCSIDLFRLYFSQNDSNLEKCRNALMSAIKIARMHIPPSYREWVDRMLADEVHPLVGQRGRASS
jgi:predicted nucleic acid-binding protein